VKGNILENEGGPVWLNMDAVKGVLIFLVVLDHNDFVRALAPAFFSSLNYHVLGFIFLPFIKGRRGGGLTFGLNMLVRYFVPFATFYTISTVAFFILYRSGEGLLLDYFTGMFVASAATLKTSSGFMMFWFLPVLFSTVIVLSYYDQLKGVKKTLVLYLFIVAHLFIGTVPAWIKDYTPMGLHIVSYVFVLGVLVRWINKGIFRRNIVVVRCASIMIFGICCAVSMYYNTHTEIGDLSVDSIITIGPLILHDVLGISGFFIIYLFSGFAAKIPLIALIGQYSMIVYLVHPLVFKVFLLISTGLDSNYAAWPFAYLLGATLSVFITIIVSLGIAHVINRLDWLHDFVTPKGYREWLVVRGVMLLRKRERPCN